MRTENRELNQELAGALSQECEELNDVIRRLDYASSIISESWKGEPTTTFMKKLQDVTEEIQQVKRDIEG
jgi:uncharacterized protein YukE